MRSGEELSLCGSPLVILSLIGHVTALIPDRSLPEGCWDKCLSALDESLIETVTFIFKLIEMISVY